jgi:hypothetical protein
MWVRIQRTENFKTRTELHRFPLHLTAYLSRYGGFAAILVLLTAAIPAHGRDKKVLQYGEGLIVNIPLPEPEVAEVVDDVAQNTIIRGTKEYNKDEYVAAAVAATSTPVFKPWTEGGKVFYKVRKQALDPLNFQDSSDVGTLAVRYVVQPQGDKNTVLRIDAVFVEDFRHVFHKSNGSVESAEYKDIQERLASVELMKKETEEALEAKKQRRAKELFSSSRDPEMSEPAPPSEEASGNPESNSQPNNQEVLGTPAATASDVATDSNANRGGETASAGGTTRAFANEPSSFEHSGETLEQYVTDLRRQVGRRVKEPGAPLKTAPFHTANTMKSLDPGTEILILITTTYWYGVETRDGDHGWLLRDQLEPMP